LYASYRPAGGRFDATHLIAQAGGRAVVGMDGRGDATIAWAQVGASRSARSIDVVERASNRVYGPVSVLATGAVSLDGIAVDPAGDAVVVLESEQGSPPTEGIMAATRAGESLADAPLASAIGPGGAAIVAWDSPTAPVQAVLAASASSPFEHPVTVAPRGEGSALPAVGMVRRRCKTAARRRMQPRDPAQDPAGARCSPSHAGSTTGHS
jgi:hypothetical protein